MARVGVETHINETKFATPRCCGGQCLRDLTVPMWLGQVKAGKLKALAVTTSKRWVELPDVPTRKPALYGERIREMGRVVMETGATVN